MSVKQRSTQRDLMDHFKERKWRYYEDKLVGWLIGGSLLSIFLFALSYQFLFKNQSFTITHAINHFVLMIVYWSPLLIVSLFLMYRDAITRQRISISERGIVPPHISINELMNNKKCRAHNTIKSINIRLVRNSNDVKLWLCTIRYKNDKWKPLHLESTMFNHNDTMNIYNFLIQLKKRVKNTKK